MACANPILMGESLKLIENEEVKHNVWNKIYSQIKIK